MDKALVIYSHPNPESFNRAILKAVTGELESKGVEYKVKDLYEMNWNPVLSAKDFQEMQSGVIPEDVLAEQRDVAWADTLIFIYPIWWAEQPAMMKGWLDRVFSEGFAYKVKDGDAKGMLADKKAVVITTSGGEKWAMKQSGMIDAIEKSMIEGTLNFVGIKDVEYNNLFAVPTATDAERGEMLEDIRQTIRYLH